MSSATVLSWMDESSKVQQIVKSIAGAAAIKMKYDQLDNWLVVTINALKN